MSVQKLKVVLVRLLALYRPHQTMHDAFGHLNYLTLCTEKTKKNSIVLPEGRLILGCGIKLKTHMHENLSRLNQFKTNPKIDHRVNSQVFN